MKNIFKISLFPWASMTSIPLFILCLCVNCNRETRDSSDAILNTHLGTDTARFDSEVFIYLPPVRNLQPNNDSVTSLILSTNDVARFDTQFQEKPYVNSIQIIDADMPWPPRWYVATPFYSDSSFEQDTKEGFYRFDMVIDAKVEADYFCFYKILSKQKFGVGQLISPEFAAYILLNKKMEPVDTIKSNTKRSNMHFRDIRINEQGERMVDLKKDTYLDLRDYTDDSNDSAVHCNVDYVHILDSNDRNIFIWNPLNHLDPELFNYKEAAKRKAFAANKSDLLEWTRLSSALWDYDGNILYAMKNIGIGKVSREHGHVIWQINTKDMPLVYRKDTLEFYCPHDLNLLSYNDTTVTYSVYSNGLDGGVKLACGVIFQMDIKTQQFKLLKYIQPRTKNFWSHGQGNIDYHLNGDYAMGYGFFEPSDTGVGYRNVMEYQKNDGSAGIYQLPKHIYVYKAHILENWPRPPRPVIVKNGNALKVVGEMKNWTWYKLSGISFKTIEKVGSGNSIIPENGAAYCVEGKYGIGFSVSRIFEN